MKRRQGWWQNRQRRKYGRQNQHHVNTVTNKPTNSVQSTPLGGFGEMNTPQ
ncbi:MAG: hypothetical protein ACLSHC_15240 [Bilophila wadsworthia]